MLPAMANRPLDSNTTFGTGGDVSRFQRRTVPGQRASGDGLALVGWCAGRFGPFRWRPRRSRQFGQRLVRVGAR